jgi:hypothetical protein
MIFATHSPTCEMHIDFVNHDNIAMRHYLRKALAQAVFRRYVGDFYAFAYCFSSIAFRLARISLSTRKAPKKTAPNIAEATRPTIAY